MMINEVLKVQIIIAAFSGRFLSDASSWLLLPGMPVVLSNFDLHRLVVVFFSNLGKGAQSQVNYNHTEMYVSQCLLVELSRLLARLMYLAPLKGTAPATAAQTPSVPDQAYGMDRKWDNSAFVRTKGGAPQLALASHVMSHLHKELQLQRAVQLCATARCRDEMLAGGVLRGRKQAWHLLGKEHCLNTVGDLLQRPKCWAYHPDSFLLLYVQNSAAMLSHNRRSMQIVW